MNNDYYIEQEIRSILSHALMMADISREDFDLAVDGCEKFVKQYAFDQCKKQRELCSHSLTVDIQAGTPAHNLVLYAPCPVELPKNEWSVATDDATSTAADNQNTHY